MLRYYEQQHLLRPERSANGYRRFAPTDVRRAQQIRELLDAGLPTRFIRAVLDMGLESDGQPVEGWTPTCTATFAAQLGEELERLDERLRALTLSRDAVRRYLGAVSVVASADAGTAS